MIQYDKFDLYCQQADRWYSEDSWMSDYKDDMSRRDFAMRELKRLKQNTLYAINKYIYLKEGDMGSGSRRYDAKPVHRVICFLVDSGYSFEMGKPRQIAATSTLGAIAMIKMVLNKNLFIKFITMDKESGEEIFEDKIKYPFGELEEWMKPEVSNDRDNLFKLSSKKKKGTSSGPNSKIQVVAPSVSAINGGSPNIVMIDEAGYIGVLGKMIKEARPTMFWQNPETKELEMKRQIIIWGTGGAMDKGGKAYEDEFTESMKKWRKREFTSGIIPIFFDWTTRPGITREFYDSEKKVYTVEGPEAESKMVQFRQTYPSTYHDMFLTSHKTLVGIDYIEKRLKDISSIASKSEFKVGYFEPIFDLTKPENDNSDLPYEIKGATFIPTEDHDPRASVKIMIDPKPDWENRYYAGTDPIATDNGYSNMSTAIWDAHYNTLAAVVNYRSSDHKETFLQSILLCMYYGKYSSKRVKELVEGNIGQAYMNYKESKGERRGLMYRTELLPVLQGGTSPLGIDNRGNRNRLIISKMHDMVVSFGDRIYYDTMFEQLRTFVCTISNSGNETWGTLDKRNFHDDVLFSATFAYICSLSFANRPPIHLKTEKQKYKIKHILVRDKNGNMTREPRKVAVR